jgi:transposase
VPLAASDCVEKVCWIYTNKNLFTSQERFATLPLPPNYPQNAKESEMLSCCFQDIPEEISSWGEKHLRLDNLYRVIGDQLSSFISVDEFTSMYSNTGRPSINPVVLSLVTIFQFLEGIPDRVAAEYVRTRLDWKYALHLPLDDSGFHYSDLCNFRKRLAEYGKESFLFDQLLKRIESLGFLKKRKYQRTDSTHILAVIGELSRLENLSEGLRVSLRAIEKADSAFYQMKIPALYREHWSKPLSDYQMSDDERKEALEHVGRDIHWLLNFLKTNKASFLGLPELEVLQTLFSQHFTLQSQKVSLKEKATTGKDKIQSIHEPEARYSTKRGKSWIGYKHHVTETANAKGEVNFITDITTTNSCEQDNETLSQIQENTEERGLKPEQQFTDKGYVTGDNLADSQEKGIQLMGEASQLDNKGLYTADEFTIDYESKTATCPAGCVSCSWKEVETGKHKGDVQIRFGQQCQDCSLKERCTKNKRGRRLRLHRHYSLLKERREESKTDSFKEAMKRRPPIEGTISEMVRVHGLRRSRYRGILKTHLQGLMIGTAVNLKRLVKAISMSKNSQKQQLATV